MKRETACCVRGILGFLALTVADQLSKLAALSWLKERQRIPLIPGVFELYYLENQGAAFGMMKGRQFFFVLIAALLMCFAAYVYRRLPQQRFYLPLRIVCIVLSAGAAGNMLDRVFRHFVIDFFYFSLIDFPVFNVADCYVTAGTGFLAVLLLTYYRNESFEFLFPSRRKGR